MSGTKKGSVTHSPQAPDVGEFPKDDKGCGQKGEGHVHMDEKEKDDPKKDEHWTMLTARRSGKSASRAARRQVMWT
ncbi:unnamed protein product [Vitrella brassicaformis CCMP3155]|uniref:Uncharacterized protein n=1 Tax=Vitrella brassicaformis (strain CCMP3155) TaxID=1169540 RepID=A0A0G4F441_VITBC|nr:unnamed protein product [Vitrella brassicaformis CCMP3155]|eukprot:CEM06790.1 unnamed protein product [Vitrella brassicaformis CCMP3155]